MDSFIEKQFVHNRYSITTWFLIFIGSRRIVRQNYSQACESLLFSSDPILPPGWLSLNTSLVTPLLWMSSHVTALQRRSWKMGQQLVRGCPSAIIMYYSLFPPAPFQNILQAMWSNNKQLEWCYETLFSLKLSAAVHAVALQTHMRSGLETCLLVSPSWQRGGIQRALSNLQGPSCRSGMLYSVWTTWTLRHNIQQKIT